MLLLVLTWVAIASASLIKPPPRFVPHHAPSYPLAVSSPYLNAWLPSNSSKDGNATLAGSWLHFWNGRPLGLTGILRIDRKPCIFMGDPEPFRNASIAEQVQLRFNNTNTTIWMNCASKYLIEINFFSPVQIIDTNNIRKYWRASVPHTHIWIKLLNIDSHKHKVEMYVDMTSEWASGDPSAEVAWEVGVADINSVASVPDPSSRWPDDSALVQRKNILTELQFQPETVGYHKFERKQQLPFVEVNDQAEWGSWYFSTGSDQEYTYQSGFADDIRRDFMTLGVLNGTVDNKTRSTNDRLPAFAFARDLGFIWPDHWDIPVETQHYMISHHQDDVAQYLGSHEDATAVPSLAINIFPTHGDAIAWCYNDRQRAELLADNHDRLLRVETEAIGPKYTGMIALTLRQAFGALQWGGSPGRPLLFMKEISSGGGTNTIDTIFAWHVMALYHDPDLLKGALLPILIQAGHNWPQQFAPHDIGSRYPNATGYADGIAKHMPVEETANMLLMMLAYVQRSKDKHFALDHWPLLRRWTDYLVNNTLYPEEQFTSDDFAKPLANGTNMALKGILGIKAFVELAIIIEWPDAQQEYSSYPVAYYDKWRKLAVINGTGPHVTHTYGGQEEDYSLLYAVFAEKLLGLNIIDPELIAMQNTIYELLLSSHGLRTNSNNTWTKIDRQMWLAGMADDKLRGRIIDRIHDYITTSTSTLPLSDMYDAQTGRVPDEVNYVNRPVVAGLFAPLALLGADQYYPRR